MTRYLTPAELQSADPDQIGKLERQAKLHHALLRAAELAIVSFAIAGWAACAWIFGKPAIEAFMALGPASGTAGFLEKIGLLSIEALAVGAVLTWVDITLWGYKGKLKSLGKDLRIKSNQMQIAMASRKDEIAAREEARAIASVAKSPSAPSKTRRI